MLLVAIIDTFGTGKALVCGRGLHEGAALIEKEGRGLGILMMLSEVTDAHLFHS